MSDRVINWGPEMTPDRPGPRYVKPIREQVAEALAEKGWCVVYTPDYLRYEARKPCHGCGETLTVDVEPFLAAVTTDWIGIANTVLKFDDEHRRTVSLCRSRPLEPWHLEGLGQE